MMISFFLDKILYSSIYAMDKTFMSPPELICRPNLWYKIKHIIVQVVEISKKAQRIGQSLHYIHSALVIF